MKKYRYKWIEKDFLSDLHRKIEELEDQGWEVWGTPFKFDRGQYKSWAINLRQERNLSGEVQE